ncbi:5-bromo-4-chloroindolyl phosphate hydrolysis family protein [Peptoniphilus stercorisuis]|uniref:5-bromo-4-chloroindolyl phosphate hydrolysis protein n=1 Tax=Peptoniphilus stercorisuis TaxID=1436965 RepID=A0ABS4KE08_9FIRM|nr:5-bromo-4-chloroindolyl phosphate hydrolysis family protein [Peptoniphilus stercorisuis]MBP2025993.1 hypothetical protein [Peptoniphilus stercorisuis]
MDNNKNNFNEKIENAFNNKDFSEINKILSSTVNSAIDFAKSSLNKFNNYLNKDQNYIPAEDPNLVLQKPPMDNKSIIFKSIGFLGFLSHSILGFVIFILSIFGKAPFMLLLDWIIPVFAISFFFYKHGQKLSLKSIRYRRYLRELGKSTVITVSDLSSAVGEDTDSVVDDLLEFIKKDYFKEARLLENNSIFVLDNNTYKIYKEHSLEDEIEKKNKKEEENLKKENLQSNKYYYSLKNIENNLTGSMKEKVSKLIIIVDKIFEFNKNNKEIEKSNYKFIEYYLPTTIKLLESYVEFSNIEIKGDNIKSAMVDIEYSMDTILYAMAKYLDDLYEHSSFDVKTDLSVLKTILSQDGLLEDDFKIRK